MASRDLDDDVLMSTGNISGTFICTWKIKAFSKLDYAYEVWIDSEKVQSDQNKYESWYLEIYPGGDKNGREGFISLYLRNESAVNMKVEVAFDLRNSEEKIIATGGTGEFILFDRILQFHNLIERKVLLPKLVDNVLLIQARVTYTVAFVSGARESPKEFPEISPKLVCNDIRRLQKEQKGTDVTISVGEEDIPVHYVMLAARSKVFSAMFEHETTEKRSRRVIIKDFDIDSVKALLQFVYSGSIEELTIDLAMDMLRAADKYGIEDLKIYCSNYLISRFDIENIANITIAADMHNADKLKETAFQFICDNRSEFDFEKHESALTGPCRSILNTIKGFLQKHDVTEKIYIRFVRE